MEALDTNHDGILSADEIAAASVSLKKLDKNGDGQLTEDELRPPPPGGRGGPPRRQDGAAGPGANRADPQNQPAFRPMPPPAGQAPFAGRDAGEAATEQPAPAAAQARRPPPRLEDDPVAARLSRDGQSAAGPTPAPADAPITLFDLLDTNHDGTLSEEELRNAPDLLKQLDLKSIGPINRVDLRPAAAATPAS